MQAQFQARGHDRLHALELPEEAGLVLDPDGADEQVLLVDAVLPLRRNLGEHVAGEKGLGEPFRLVAVAPHARHERQVMRETLDGEQRGEFFFAPRPGVAGEPARLGEVG